MKTSLDLPDDLYRRLKAACALQGRSVRDVAIELFTDWVTASSAPQVREAATSATSDGTTLSSRAWMAEWERLGREMRARSDESSGLVDDLMRSRR